MLLVSDYECITMCYTDSAAILAQTEMAAPFIENLHKINESLEWLGTCCVESFISDSRYFDSCMADTESPKDPRRAHATSGSESDAEDEAKKLFMKYVTEGRKLVEEGEIAKAIKLNEKALAIKHSEKLQKRIEKMKVRPLKV